MLTSRSEKHVKLSGKELPEKNQQPLEHDQNIQYLDYCSIQVDMDNADTTSSLSDVQNKIRALIASNPVDSMRKDLIQRLLYCLEKTNNINLRHLEDALASVSTREEKRVIHQNIKADYIQYCQTRKKIMEDEPQEEKKEKIASLGKNDDPIIQYLAQHAIQTEIEHADEKTDWADIEKTIHQFLTIDLVDELKPAFNNQLLNCLEKKNNINLRHLEDALASVSTREEKRAIHQNIKADYIQYCQTRKKIMEDELQEEKKEKIASLGKNDDPIIQYLAQHAIQTEIEHADEKTDWADIEKTIHQFLTIDLVDELKRTFNNQLLICYIKLNKYPLASYLASQLLSDNPDDFSTLYMKGIADFHLDELSNARDFLERALKQAGQKSAILADIHFLLSQTYERELQKCCEADYKKEQDFSDNLQHKKDEINEAIQLLSCPETSLNDGIQLCEQWMAFKKKATQHIQTLIVKRDEHIREAHKMKASGTASESDAAKEKDVALSLENTYRIYKILRQSLPVNYTIYRSQTAQLLLDMLYYLNQYFLKNISLKKNIDFASRVTQLIIDSAEYSLKKVQREIDIIKDPAVLKWHGTLSHVLEITQWLILTVEHLWSFFNPSQLDNYRFNYYVKSCLEILVSLSLLLLNHEKYGQPHQILDLMFHENLLKIPEVHDYLLEPNPEESGFYLKLFVGKFLENLSTRKKVSPLSLVSDWINDRIGVVQKPINYLNKMSNMLFSWEAWATKCYTNVYPALSSLWLPRLLPLNNPIYLNILFFQKNTQIVFALGDTICNQEQDREYCLRKHQLKIAAQQGSADANYYLGEFYAYENNMPAAEFYYHEAAKKNHSDALDKLNAILLSQQINNNSDAFKKPSQVTTQSFDFRTMGLTAICMTAIGLFAACSKNEGKSQIALFFSTAVAYLGYTESLKPVTQRLKTVGFFRKRDTLEQLSIPQLSNLKTNGQDIIP